MGFRRFCVEKEVIERMNKYNYNKDIGIKDGRDGGIFPDEVLKNKG